MGRKRQLAGMKFGRLTVLEEANRKNNKKVKWICICECGKLRECDGGHLIGGRTKSCGCLRSEMVSKSMKTHGMTKGSLHTKWSLMKRRCKNENDENYGGRGITVCEEWANSFEKFRDWSLENGFQEGLQIDRVDNNKGYSPDNCRFVTNLENINNRRVTIFAEINGVNKPLSEWALECGISYGTIYSRMKKGLIGIELILPPKECFKGRTHSRRNKRITEYEEINLSSSH